MNKKQKCLSIVSVLLLLIVLGAMAGKTQLAGQTVKAAGGSALQKYLQEHAPVRKVRVAILDTGVDEKQVNATEMDTGVNLTNDVDTHTANDDNGHGTKIAKLVTEYESDCIKLLPIKVADASGNAGMDSLCRGLEEAVKREADIIIMSMNMAPSDNTKLLESKIEAAVKKGIPVIVPAGNEGLDVKNAVPAGMDAAMVIAAASVDGRHVDYSNYGDTIDYAAYGGCYGEFGTSFSAARVAGMLAGVYARGGDTSVFDGLLQDLGTPGQDNCYGKGFVSLTQSTVSKAGEGYEFSYGTEEQEAYELDYNSVMQLEWKNMETEELDMYLANTDAVYIGYFLEHLDKEDLKLFKEKSKMLDNPVNVSIMGFEGEETDTFRVREKQEYTFYDYCIEEYKAVKDTAQISEWRYKNGIGCVFYISSANRKNVWKYEVKGFNNCYMADSIFIPSPESHVSAQIASGKITVVETCIKGMDGGQGTMNGTSVEHFYQHPQVDKISALAYSARGHEVSFSSSDGSVNTTFYNPQYIAIGNDDGTILYSLSISFKNFVQEAEGYHMDSETIAVYKYNTTSPAMTYERAVVTTKESPTGGPYVKFLTREQAKTNGDDDNRPEGLYHYWTAKDTYYNQKLQAKKIVKGTLKVNYAGSFIPGVIYDSEMEDEYYKDKMTTGATKTSTVYRSYGNNEIKSGQTTFSLQFDANNLGVDMYSDASENVVMSSDKAEYVIGMAENTYEVVYNGNKSTSGGTSTQKVNYFDTFKLRSNGFRRTGYTFKEWNTKANGKGTAYKPGQSVSKLAGASDNNEKITLYAIWEPMAAKVVFHPNGGTAKSGYFIKNDTAYKESDSSQVTKTVTYATASVDLVNVGTLFTRLGYKVIASKAWHIGSAASTDYISHDSGTAGNGLAKIKKMILDGDTVIHLYANWEKSTAKYSVKHHKQNIANDKYTLAETETLSGTLGASVTPSTKSYTGFTSPNKQTVTIKADGSTVVNYYYIRNTSTLAVNPNGGTWNGKTITQTFTHKYETTKAIPLPTHADAGYAFQGWQKSSSFYGSITSLHAAATYTFGATKGVTSTLTAAWKAKAFTLTVKPNGGAWEGKTTDSTFSLNYKSTKTIANPTRRGFSFAGWTLSGAGSTMKGTTFTMGNANAVLTANWTRNNYKLTVKPNGGVWNGTKKDSEFSLPYESAKNIENPTRDGYQFIGWALTGAGSKLEEMDANNQTFTMGYADAIIEADWKPNTYYIQFDGNGATEGEMEMIVATVDEPFTLPENVFKRVLEQGDSKFLGWARIPEDRLPEFGNQQEININLTLNQGETVVLYAIWDDCPWVEAPDRYFNLWWAQNGKITEKELLNTVTATDREDVTLECRTSEEIAEVGEESSVSLFDYDISVFTSMIGPGEVPVTYKAVDSIGNVVYKDVLVHIFDTNPLQPTENMYLRFINRKYYEKSYEEGGLHPNSIWRLDAAYRTSLEEALTNLENNTPQRVYSFTPEEVQEAKKYVDEHGFSDTKEAGALQGFFNRFMR